MGRLVSGPRSVNPAADALRGLPAVMHGAVTVLGMAKDGADVDVLGDDHGGGGGVAPGHLGELTQMIRFGLTDGVLAEAWAARRWLRWWCRAWGVLRAGRRVPWGRWLWSIISTINPVNSVAYWLAGQRAIAIACGSPPILIGCPGLFVAVLIGVSVAERTLAT